MLLQALVRAGYLLEDDVGPDGAGELKRVEHCGLDFFVFVIEVDEECLADVLEGAVGHAELCDEGVRSGSRRRL